jgi:hypothetical protein
MCIGVSVLFDGCGEAYTRLAGFGDVGYAKGMVTVGALALAVGWGIRSLGRKRSGE